MKEQYIRDLVEGAKVDSVFALHSRDIRSARTGDAFLSLEMGDSTGRMSAVMFRPSPTEEALPIGSVVRIVGKVTTYRGARRVAVDAMSPVASYDVADLQPSGTRDRRELLDELRGLVRRVKDPRLRAVVRAVYGAPGFIDAFASSPAGSGRHHAYIGGLLEHTVSVAAHCVALAAAYPQADADLLLSAALLHDVGKVEELAYGPSVDYTDAGRLIGHVVLGERTVSRAIEAQPRQLDPAVAMRLSHALLAHHGSPEWGAPRSPVTLEALLLHHADNLDAQVAAFLGAVSGAAVLEQTWSDGTNSFGRPLVVPGPVGGRHTDVRSERACA